MMNLFLIALFLTVQIQQPDPEFQRLVEALKEAKIELKLAKPPGIGNYGAFEAKSRTIWLDPLTFDLGIAKPTLVHESVHVAQGCKGKGQPVMLGLDLETSPLIRRYFMRYKGDRRDLEREAYSVQVQENGVDLAIALLHNYC